MTHMHKVRQSPKSVTLSSGGWHQDKTFLNLLSTPGRSRDSHRPTVVAANLTASGICYNPNSWTHLWGIFLIRSFEVGRFILSLAHLLVAAHWQGCGRRKLLLFACLPSLSLASSSTLLLPFAGVRIHFFGIPTYIEDQQLPGNSSVLLP